MIIGILLVLAGAGAIVYGYMQNNSFDAQLGSLLSNGSTDPGTIFIIIGVFIAVFGLIIILHHMLKKRP